jgi:hypothetical protein
MSEYPPAQPYPPAPGPQFPPAQQPYGQPVKNTLANASLVLGIVSLFASLLFLPAVVGVVLGILGLQRAGRTTPPAGKGKAIAGIVLSGVGLLVGIGLVNAIAEGGDAAPDDAATSITQDADAGEVQPADDAGEPAEEPAAEPVEEATPPPPPVDPFVEVYGTFEAVTTSGTGKSVVTLPAGVPAAMVTAQHSGQSNYALNILDATNQPTGDLLVNTIGNYSGTTAYGMNAFGGDPVSLQVEADGQWTITIAPLATAPELAVPYQGAGDGVFRYLGGATQWTFTHAGSSNFAVIQYGGIMPGLLVNEIGQFQGTVPVTGGPSIVTVTADGAWTVG